MNTHAQSYEETPVAAVHLHPRNPRRGDVAAIGESIEANGWFGAILAQKSSGYILAGNHRYRAAVARGARAVPVLWIDCDDADALRIMLADNRTSDLADYDRGELADLLRHLRETDGRLTGSGYGDADINAATATGAAEMAADQTGELTERFQVLVDCRCEDEQRSLVERLVADGFACRALLA